MPSNFSTLDNGFPNLNQYGSTEQKLRAIEDYLYQLLEQLRYTLNNLGAENFNEQSLKDIAAPIYKDIKDTEAGLETQIEANAEGISTLVTKTGINELGEDETIYSRFEQKSDDINLQVNGASAPEWTAGTVYTKDTVVKVTTAATSSAAQSIAYYKAKSTHTAAAGNKPPNSSYWTVTDAPNVRSMIDLNLTGLTLSYNNDSSHVGSEDNAYITLKKDGVEIGGGKLKVKNLDASTITTGSLDAGNVQLKDLFSVVATRNEGGSIYSGTCGKIGGYIASLSPFSPVLEIQSVDGKREIAIGSEEIEIRSYFAGDISTHLRVNDDSRYGVEIDTRYDENYVNFRVTSTKVEIRKNNGTWYDLFSLFT